MTSDRAYRKALAHDIAISEIDRCGGSSVRPGARARLSRIDRRVSRRGQVARGVPRRARNPIGTHGATDGDRVDGRLGQGERRVPLTRRGGAVHRRTIGARSGNLKVVTSLTSRRRVRPEPARDHDDEVKVCEGPIDASAWSRSSRPSDTRRRMVFSFLNERVVVTRWPCASFH